MLGSANFDNGPVLRFMSGNLCYQIEHHLFPDLPSNRLHEISIRVRQLCDKYDLPYTTGPFLVQYGKTWRTIAKLSLPNKFLRDTVDDAPETRSEQMFAELGLELGEIDPATGNKRGLRSAIVAVRKWRRQTKQRPPRRRGRLVPFSGICRLASVQRSLRGLLAQCRNRR